MNINSATPVENTRNEKDNNPVSQNAQLEILNAIKKLGARMDKLEDQRKSTRKSHSQRRDWRKPDSEEEDW